MLTPNLVSWQWRTYSNAHRDRKNLALHLATVPLFTGGFVVLAASSVFGSSLVAGLGALAMVIALAAQGKGHRAENEPPAPFRSPLDFVARFFTEQFVTFPRFVLSGAFARAWRDAGKSGAAAPVTAR